MKIAESVFMPVAFVSLWQTEREKEFFDKQKSKLERREKRLAKAGLTMSPDVLESVIGDIRYEVHYWRDVAAMTAYSDAVLDGLKAGRISL